MAKLLRNNPEQALSHHLPGEQKSPSVANSESRKRKAGKSTPVQASKRSKVSVDDDWKWNCQVLSHRCRPRICERPDDEDGELWVQCDECGAYAHAKHANVLAEATRASNNSF